MQTPNAWRALLLGAFLLGWELPANAAELTVRLDNPPATGTIAYVLFDSPNAFGDLRDPMKVRQGNRYLRTAFIEANQRGYCSARLGKDVKARRAHRAPEYVAIADRCLRRLNKKGNRQMLAGKHPNKVKVSCAREMVRFIWESLNRVAA